MGDLVLAIDAVHAGVVDDGEGCVVGAEGGEVAVGRDDVQPLGEEEVDLLDVLFERGVAGGVDVGVEGGAETFGGVQDDVGGLEVGLAVGGAVELLAGFSSTGVRQRSKVPLLRVERQLWQWLHSHQADDEDGSQNEAEKHKHVLRSAQPLPALALGIEEDLFAH